MTAKASPRQQPSTAAHQPESAVHTAQGPAPSSAADAWLGDGVRFSVQRVLGQGGSGTVYQAYDRVRDASVAVKLLSHVDPAALFRFKAEFRTLVGLSHPNLVQLHELVLSAEQWLLTMELVEGGDFLKYVRADAADAPQRALFDDSGATEDLGLIERHLIDVAQDVPREPGSGIDSSLPRGSLDEGRLRESLRQLCEGLQALHRSGRVHRDLKPANVLVFSETGRVVICDFGLALETGSQGRTARGHFGAHAGHSSTSMASGEVAGTLVYMSPEQALGVGVNEATDWYAVGVMLYQALTGVTPFSSGLSLREMLASKILRTPTDPMLLDPSAPRDLAELALALLLPVPGVRAGYRDVMQCLIADEVLPSSAKRPSFCAQASARLTGRESELGALERALRRVRDSGAQLVFVSGPSGMGKSAVVDSFLGSAGGETCLILAGRCYEREQLPYKVFDPLMDALSSYLLELDDKLIQGLLPPGTQALRRLFPVLDRVPALRDFKAKGAESNGFDVRREAFSALRELFKRLSALKPLLLYVDDLQWGDLDSAPLFIELLRQPDAPSVLMLCAYRSEEQAQSPLLRALGGEYLREGGVAEPERIEVNRLTEADCRALALSLLADPADAEAIASQIAREAQGSPFFVGELAAYVRAVGSQSAAGLTLDAVIRARLATLPEEQRRMLSLVAVAGRPEPLDLIFRNAQIQNSALGVLSALEAQHLVRSTGPSASDRVEVYHDQIREAAYRMLSDGQRQDTHRRLAEAIEQTSAEPEALFRHWRAADETARAAHYAVQAAALAEASLAFDRAAELYEAALALLDASAPGRRELQERLGNALMGAGHGARAASVFFDALPGAPPERAAELRLLGITQLLRAGQLEAAFAELDKAEHLLGVPVPRTDAQAIWMLSWRSALVALGGKRLRVRSSGSLDPALDARMTMLWSIGAALACVDQLRGNVYNMELVLLARKTGDPYHLACALSLLTTLVASRGTDPGQVDELVDRALEMAGRSGNPHALSVVSGTVGVSRMVQGRFMEAVRLIGQSWQLLQHQRGATLAWDRVTMVFFEILSLALIGDVQQIIERVPEASRAADARGDRLASTLFRSFRCCWAYLGIDDPVQARAQAERAAQHWQQPGYSLQHFYVSHALAEIALYSGVDVEAALSRIEREWKVGYLLRKIQSLRIELLWLRARLALTLAERAGDPALYELARTSARSLEREGMTWGLVFARLLDAAICRAKEPARSLALLREAASLSDAVDMKLLSAVACWLVARTENPPAGDEREAQAYAEIRGYGVRRPEGFVRLLAPGLTP